MQIERVREEQLNVRLNPEEQARFKRLAEHYGVSAATMVRMLVKEKERELGLVPPPAPPPSAPRTKATAKKR